MAISLANVVDWSCEETCDWFLYYGFYDPGVIERLQKHGTCARHILDKDIPCEVLGIVSVGGLVFYPIRIKELRIRNELEKKALLVSVDSVNVIEEEDEEKISLQINTDEALELTTIDLTTNSRLKRNHSCLSFTTEEMSENSECDYWTDDCE